MDIHNKRLKHERAINNYTGNLQEKKYYNKFHTKCNLLHNLPRNYKSIWFWKSAHHKESHQEKKSDILKSSQSWMCPLPQLGCFHFLPMEPLLCTKFFFYHDSMHKFCIVLVQNYHYMSLAYDKNAKSKWREIFKYLICGSKGTNQSSSCSLKWTNQKIVEKRLAS